MGRFMLEAAVGGKADSMSAFCAPSSRGRVYVISLGGCEGAS